jgi:hypothetical protein
VSPWHSGRVTKDVIPLILLTFLAFASSVSAVQDAYITVDNKGSGVCLGVDSPSNTVCNTTYYLPVDGTRDHNLYFVADSGMASNSSAIQTTAYLALTPFNVILGASGFVLAAFVAAFLAYLLLTVTGAIPK